MKKRKKKSFLLFVCVIVVMSACVYCSLPSKKIEPENVENKTQADVQEEAEETSEIEEMIEAYFKGRPVRDIPENADFSSFLKGSFARRGKNFALLAQSYENVLKTDPQNNDIKSALFTYFMLAGDIKKSAVYAEQALQVKPDNMMAKVVKLTEAIKNANYDEALSITEKLSPTHDAFLVPVAKAWIYTGQKDLESAINSLDSIQMKELKSVQLLFKAMIYDYFGKPKQAAEFYNKLMQTADFKNVRVLMLLQEFENRTHLITDKDGLKKTYAVVEEESFISKEMMSQNRTGEKPLSMQEGMSWALFDLSSLLVHSGELELSLCYAQMARYLNPKSSVIHLYVGEVLEFMELYDQANDLYAKVSSTQNIYLSSKMRTVLNLIKTKQYDDAEKIVLSLLKAYPNVPLFYMTLGDIYRENAKYEQALLNYDKALAFVSADDKQVAPVYFYKGICYDLMNDNVKALGFYEKALQLDAQNPTYLNYVGYSWLEENKNIPEALTLIQKAVSKSPNNGTILDSLGWAYFMMEDYEKALGILERAVSLEAGNAVINSHLGDVYWKLKRYREAKFQWSHAATLKQESSPKLLSELSDKLANGLKK